MPKDKGVGYGTEWTTTPRGWEGQPAWGRGAGAPQVGYGTEWTGWPTGVPGKEPYGPQRISPRDRLNTLVAIALTQGINRLIALVRAGARPEDIHSARQDLEKDLVSIYYAGINYPEYGGIDIAGGRDVQSWAGNLVWGELGKRGEGVRQATQRGVETGLQLKTATERPPREVPPAPEDWASIYMRRMPKFESPAMREYYEAQGPTIRREYLAQLATPTPGVPPVSDFGEFLSKYKWLEKYMMLPPRQRGAYPSRFAPPTRWLGY